MTNLVVNLSSQLQTTLSPSGVWAYAVYFNGSSPVWTDLVLDGAVQSGGSASIALPQPFNSGKVYFLIQSQDAARTYDLSTLIAAESDISWNNAATWNFRFDSFEVTLDNGSTDDGNLTEVVGFGLPMGVSISYSDGSTATVGYNITGTQVFNDIEAINSEQTVLDYTEGPLASNPRMGVSPSQAVGNSPTIPAFQASDWNSYISSLEVASPGVEISGFYNGAADADGVWHNAGFFSYTLEWDSTDSVFWLSPNDNSEVRGYVRMSASDLADSIYSTLGDVGIFASKTDAEPYQILNHPSLGPGYTMNSGENNQWGKVLSEFLTGFSAGYYGTSGQPENALITDTVDLNQNWNWDPTYAFGQNLSGAAAPYQDPYSQIFFVNSNSYGSGYSDALMQQYAVGGPLVSVSNPGGNVGTINLTIYDDGETPSGYTTPVIYNYIAPGSGYEIAYSLVAANNIKLNLTNTDMVVADDTTISLDVYTGTTGGVAQFQSIAFDLPSGQSPWQEWLISEGTGGSYTATLQTGTSQGIGQFLISSFPTAASGTSWYRLHVGSGDDEKIFNLYVETSGSAFLNPTFSGQAGSLAVDGLGTTSPQSSAASTIEAFTINFLYSDTTTVDPDLLVRIPSATENAGVPNAPVAGTISGGTFTALSGQTGQVSNTITTTQSSVAFGWTGLNNDPSTGSWISGYTNKVGGQDFAQLKIDGRTTLVATTQGDVDGQWQTTAQSLGNGHYTITMEEYFWSDVTQQTQIGDTSSALNLTVNVDELALTRAAGKKGLALVPNGPDDPSGSWIEFKTLKAPAKPGKTVLLYAVDETGQLVDRDSGEAGAGVTLEDAALASIGAVSADNGKFLARGVQSVYLSEGLKLHFAVLKADGTISAKPHVKIKALDDGGKLVKVGAYVFKTEADNTLSAGGMLAETQRSTDAPFVYVEQGDTFDIALKGASNLKNTLGFVRFDIDSVSGAWSVDGVAYGDTAAFRQAVLDNLDSGFQFTRGGYYSTTESWTVAGESGYYAPVLTKGGKVYVIGDANHDGTDHIRLFGQNLFGFEDRGDFDYNDLVIRLSPSKAGDDIVYSGTGPDKLKGGAGDDTFYLFDRFDSGVGAKARDTILDFEGSGGAGGDLIDLSSIDADEGTGGDDAFTFTANKGLDAFQAGVAGQLRYVHVKAGTVVHGETTGDGKADFSILVKGIHQFSTVDGEDFIL